MAKWDLYDRNGEKVEQVIEDKDSEKIPNGLYHLSLNIWIINQNKEALLIKKALNYNLHNPGSWTSINVNVESGEEKIDAIKRILKEKIGITIDEKKFKEIGMDFRDPHNYIYNIFVISDDLKESNIVFNNKYISKVKWANLSEIKNMINNGEIELSLLPRIEKYIFPLLQ